MDVLRDARRRVQSDAVHTALIFLANAMTAEKVAGGGRASTLRRSWAL
jgi:hypothetical protein